MAASIRISQRERDVIFAAQLSADAPAASIRSVTGYRDHTIRYFLQRALDRGIIARRCFINLNALGFSQFEVFFSLSSEKKESRKALLQTLIKSEHVSWLGELGGDYQYGLSFCARTIREVWDFLDQLSGRFGPIFLEKTIAIRISFSYFGNKYLSNKKRTSKSMSYAVQRHGSEIEEIDHRVLGALTSLPHTSMRDLARQLALPIATLDYRLRKLKQSGIMVGYYYEVQPARIGMQVFTVLVSVKGINSALKEKMTSFCERHPNVVVLIHTIGSWDFELTIEVEDARQSMRLAEDLHDDFGTYLNSVKVLPFFAHVKISEYPFRRFETAQGQK